MRPPTADASSRLPLGGNVATDDAFGRSAAGWLAETGSKIRVAGRLDKAGDASGLDQMTVVRKRRKASMLSTDGAADAFSHYPRPSPGAGEAVERRLPGVKSVIMCSMLKLNMTMPWYPPPFRGMGTHGPCT